jgi:hypothetical protein
VVGEFDGGWAVVAGAGVGGCFDAVVAVAGAFDHAGIAAVAALAVQAAAAGDIGLDSGQ